MPAVNMRNDVEMYAVQWLPGTSHAELLGNEPWLQRYHAHTPEGVNMHLRHGERSYNARLGDWIITLPDGSPMVLSDESFRSMFNVPEEDDSNADPNAQPDETPSQRAARRAAERRARESASASNREESRREASNG